MRGFIDVTAEVLPEAVAWIPARIVGSADRDGGIVRLIIEADYLPAEHCECLIHVDAGRRKTASLEAAL